MNTNWIPMPGEKLYFVSSMRNSHVHYYCNDERIKLDENTGRIRLELELMPHSATPTLEETLAVAILRGDPVAALAAADDVAEKTVRLDWFQTRDELHHLILCLRLDLERAERKAALLHEAIKLNEAGRVIR